MLLGVSDELRYNLRTVRTGEMCKRLPSYSSRLEYIPDMLIRKSINPSVFFLYAVCIRDKIKHETEKMKEVISWTLNRQYNRLAQI